MKRKIEQNSGITLVALVVTIIILIILAGVSIHLILGKNGMINMAERAKKDYINGEQEEENSLEKLYSSLLIATNDDSTVTISMKDLNALIDEKVKESIKNQNHGIIESDIQKTKVMAMLCLKMDRLLILK